MDINTAAGEKVVFAGRGGWLGDIDSALQQLNIGQEYTVKSMNVGQSSSTVTLEEVPNKRYNTAMFKNNTPTWKRFDWFREVCYIGFGSPYTEEQFAKMLFRHSDMSDEVLKQIAPATEAEIVAPMIKLGNKNALVTAKRYSDQQLTVLNPKDDQEVIDLFMERYGYEPFSMQKMWFDKSFDPSSHFKGNCTCD